MAKKLSKRKLAGRSRVARAAHFHPGAGIHRTRRDPKLRRQQDRQDERRSDKEEVSDDQ